MCKCHCVYHTDTIQVLGYRPFDPLISRRFRQLCGCSELVPISYTIPGEQITTVEKYPIATGGFGDVWKCAYDGRRVAVKALRVYKDEDMHKVKRVRRSSVAIREFRPLTFFLLGVLQGGYHVETTVTPQHCSLPWSHRYPCPTVHGVGVDAEWGCTKLRREASRSGSVTAGMSYPSFCPIFHAFLRQIIIAPRHLSRAPGSSYPRHSPR